MFVSLSTNIQSNLFVDKRQVQYFIAFQQIHTETVHIQYTVLYYERRKAPIIIKYFVRNSMMHVPLHILNTSKTRKRTDSQKNMDEQEKDMN